LRCYGLNLCLSSENSTENDYTQLNFLISHTLTHPSESNDTNYDDPSITFTPINGLECPTILYIYLSIYGFHT